MSDFVLIVDDDEDYASVVRRVILELGQEGKVVLDATSALEVMKERLPEVMLLDWDMPGVNGLELLKTIRANKEYDRCYIIMVTGQKSISARVDALNAGADDYLTKPFANEELAARVKVGSRACKFQKALTEHARLTTALEMAVALSHELRNPLASASLLCDVMLTAKDVSPDSREQINILRNQLRRMDELILRAQSITTVTSIPYTNKTSMVDLRPPQSNSNNP